MADGTCEGAEKNKNGRVEGLVEETGRRDEREMTEESCEVLAESEEKCCMAKVCWWDGEREDKGRERGSLIGGEGEE